MFYLSPDITEAVALVVERWFIFVVT